MTNPILPKNSWTLTDNRIRYEKGDWMFDRYGHKIPEERVLQMISEDLDALNRLDSYFRETSEHRESCKKKLNELKRRIKG